MKQTSIVPILLLALLTGIADAQTGKCISGNCKTGRGKMLYADSSVYEGGWVGGQRQGMGTYEEKESSYTGMWKADVKSDSGVFIEKHILHSENRLYAEDVRIGRVSSGKLSGPGVFVSLAMSLGKMDTLLMWKGNFVDDQLSGHGSMYVARMVTDYSENWTDNYHFSDGRSVDYKTGAISEGSFANGIITPRAGTTATTSPAPPASAPASNDSKSMLDYGIFDTHQKKLPASYGTDH